MYELVVSVPKKGQAGDKLMVLIHPHAHAHLPRTLPWGHIVQNVRYPVPPNIRVPVLRGQWGVNVTQPTWGPHLLDLRPQMA